MELSGEIVIGTPREQVWAGLNARRREHAVFSSDAGVPLFSLRRPSRADGAYDAFVDALITQIRAVKGMPPS